MRAVLLILAAVGCAGCEAEAASATQTGQQVSDAGVRLAMIGGNPGSARWPPFGRPWFALHRTPAGDRLDPVSVGLTVVEDACRGRDTVVTVSGLSAQANVRFLVQWDRLKAGPVQTAWAEPRFLYPGQEQPIQLAADRWFRLSAYGLAEPGLIYNYRLVLSSGETDQRVAQLNVVSMDGPPTVVWAGDLDRDGRLDLLADLTTDYVGHEYVLYVSSLASAGNLVAEGTRLGVPGC
jgi:hypothetical protein